MKQIINRSGNTPFRLHSARFAGRIVLATSLSYVFSGCNPTTNSGNPPTAQSSEASRSPQTAEVTKRDIIEQIPLNANLIVPPPAQASVSEPFKSPVERVYKSVGEYVKRGEPIVELGIPSDEVYREQAAINLKQAQSEYASAKSVWNPRIEAAKQALAEAESAVKQAKKVAQSSHTTTTDPETGTVVEASESSTSSVDMQAAVEQRRQAEQALAQVRAEMQQELAPFDSRIAEARAAQRQARATDNAGLVKAPISGVVTTLNAQPGQEVDGNQSTPVATIVNLDALQIHASMPPNYASHVKEGMNVIATFDEVPGKEFKGRVKQLTTRNSNQEYIAIITFTNKGYDVKPGYHAHAGVTTGRSVKDQLAVPAEAVDYENKKWFVQVRKDDKWVKTAVTPGVSDGKFTSIESGIKENDTVLVTPGS